jgi:hypothetical protein
MGRSTCLDLGNTRSSVASTKTTEQAQMWNFLRGLLNSSRSAPEQSFVIKPIARAVTSTPGDRNVQGNYKKAPTNLLRKRQKASADDSYDNAYTTWNN